MINLLKHSTTNGQHFGVINGTVPLNLGHTKAKIDVLCGLDAMTMCVVWPRFNDTVPLMTPKCCPPRIDPDMDSTYLYLFDF